MKANHDTINKVMLVAGFAATAAYLVFRSYRGLKDPKLTGDDSRVEAPVAGNTQERSYIKESGG